MTCPPVQLLALIWGGWEGRGGVRLATSPVLLLLLLLLLFPACWELVAAAGAVCVGSRSPVVSQVADREGRGPLGLHGEGRSWGESLGWAPTLSSQMPA